MTRLRTLIMVAPLALVALAACEERTSVVVTVDIDPAFESQVRQLRFVTRLMDGDTVLTEDTRNNPESPASGPLTFPNSFVVVADGRGKNGEIVEVFVEGLDATGDGVARARETAPLAPGKETSMQLRLGAPCGEPSECVAAGTAFCDDPHLCLCEGDTCEEGFCKPVPLDDGNSCTETVCDEASQIVTVTPVEDGTICGTSAGTPLSCAGGVCGCGDGETNPDVEQCDEGEANANDPNRCRTVPACQLPVCGDGIIDDREPFNEECDDGEQNNSFAPDACRPNCKLPACGDFIQDTGEECDEGVGNDDAMPLACRTDCLTPHCGDGVVDVGFAFGATLEEECDLGAMNSNTDVDGCRQMITLENGTGATVECKVAFCGDAVTDTGERCDDNNSTNGDGCNPTCVLRGDVSLLAGTAGGRGSADGTGSGARVGDVRDISIESGIAYFVVDGDHTIRSVDPATGEVTTLAGFPAQSGDIDGIGSAARLSFPRAVAANGTDLYFVEAGNHKLKHMDIATNTVSTLAGTGFPAFVDGPFATAQFAGPAFAALRSPTELIVMDTLTSAGCRLRSVDLTGSTVSFVAGNSTCSFTADGAGSAARFRIISGMAMGAEPFLYVADDNKIRRVDLSASPATVTTIAGAGPGFVNANGLAARFDTLGDLAVGPGNELYIADLGNGVLRHLDLTTMDVTTVATTGSLIEPRTLGIDGTTLLLAENNETTIRIGDLVVSPMPLPVLAGKTGQSGATDGAAVAALFDEPIGLAVGTSAPTLDQLYVAEKINGTVRVIDLGAADNAVTTLPTTGQSVLGVTSAGGRLFASMDQLAGREVVELNPVTGAITGIGATAIPIGDIFGLAVLGGHVYIGGPGVNVVWRIDLAGGAAEVFAGTVATPGLGDGDISVATFGAPFDIVECAGMLYVAESDTTFAAHVIREIDVTAQTVDTFAGSATTPGAIDDFGTDARFDGPEGIACDGTSLYVADSNSHLIRQIELDTGRVTTLAGVPYESGAVDGTGVGARFNEPMGLVYDPTTGDLFVTDNAENVVRRIQ